VTEAGDGVRRPSDIYINVIRSATTAAALATTTELDPQVTVEHTGHRVNIVTIK